MPLLTRQMKASEAIVALLVHISFGINQHFQAFESPLTRSQHEYCLPMSISNGDIRVLLQKQTHAFSAAIHGSCMEGGQTPSSVLAGHICLEVEQHLHAFRRFAGSCYIHGVEAPLLLLRYRSMPGCASRSACRAEASAFAHKVNACSDNSIAIMYVYHLFFTATHTRIV
jgi:hypothetical protein